MPLSFIYWFYLTNLYLLVTSSIKQHYQITTLYLTNQHLSLPAPHCTYSLSYIYTPLIPLHENTPSSYLQV